MAIAEQMGVTLANTAYSVNIKERLDFSCALFDADGNLIANAPHMPVHLGSMSESIKTVIARNAGRLKRGDVYALNDPYHGGTHLPDVTVVTPVYLEDASEAPTFYVGSRGHHADIGGTTPGSMPPFSTRIEEEGVQFDNGARISVAIRVDAQARSAEIDFTGTSAQLENNFNAPTAVSMAAVLYVFRTLVDDEIPLNAGCLKPIKVIIPEGSMLNPRPPASVVAGNVETST